VLFFIVSNPGVTVNRIYRSLGLNPSPTRDYLKTLVDKGLIEDRPDESGAHHYFVKEAVA
jgi:DNA-binding IclR family transcriptional regulator